MALMDEDDVVMNCHCGPGNWTEEAARHEAILNVVIRFERGALAWSPGRPVLGEGF